MNCPFSKFKNALGVPGEGIHKSKLLGVALADYIGTILLAILVSWLTKWPLVLVTVILFILGFILHVLFGVQTELVKWFGIKC